MKRFMIGMLFAIPGTSVVLGITMLILALNSPDARVSTEDGAPMSKTSWQVEQ